MIKTAHFLFMLLLDEIKRLILNGLDCLAHYCKYCILIFGVLSLHNIQPHITYSTVRSHCNLEKNQAHNNI